MYELNFSYSNIIICLIIMKHEEHFFFLLNKKILHNSQKLSSFCLDE